MKMEGQIATTTGPEMYRNSQIVSSASLKIFFSKERPVIDLFLIITIIWWLLKLMWNLLGFLLKIPIIRELMNSYLGKVKKKVSDFVKKTMEEQFLSYFLYGLKLEELKKFVKKLQEKRDRIQRRVDDEFRNGKDTADDVSKWFDDTDDTITEYDNFLQDEHLPYTMCHLPKPWLRYRLAKKAYSLARKVNNLLEYSFPGGLFSGERPMSIDFLLSVVNFETFNSRKQVTENITKALKDATIKMVGVYGMGGVGKTTLVKEVASTTRRDKLFDVVIFTSVTRYPDIKQIQGQLADQLGARLNEETEIGRASRLRDIFKKEKKNTLVILDDLWAKLDLNKLGLPVDDVNLSPNSAEESTKSQRSNQEGTSADGRAKKEATGDSRILKILLTSRSKEVVFDKMHVKENSVFPIKGLDDQEAEVLFKKMVGMVDKPPEFEPLVADISQRCSGLPIAVVTIGTTLRTKSYLQWKETLGQLERQKFTEVAESVDFSTRLSFNYLENEELKSTFLLCAQLGYHPLIMDLVKYCIGMGIFEGFLTIKETREKVLRLIEKLKDSSLLLDSYSDDRFNMHDMIRESVLSIASKEQHFFTMRNGELKEWPYENEFKRYNGISIRNCNINDKLPNSVSCPKLKIFHVDCANHSFNIPKCFFQRARQLRALILTGIDVSNFCASIGCSTNLRMLCLEKCKLGDLSFIGKMEKLRILSLSGSSIEILPVELGELHKLQLLDISNCLELRKIRPNTLSRLSSLEELYMRNSGNWGSEENQSDRNNTLAELRHLHQLKHIDICLSNVAVLPRNLFLEKLDSYKIVIGDFGTLSDRDLKMTAKNGASRVLALQIEEPNVIHYQECVKMLFRGVEKMFLGEVKGVRSIFYELSLEGFPCLKELSIERNSDIEYIIDPKELLNLNYVFPILESLCLKGLSNMKKIISHGTNFSGTSFSRLKVVKISHCARLESVFSLSMVLLLKNLETIQISECEFLKTVVLKEELDDAKINFPKLRSLALDHLCSFTGIYSNDHVQNDILFNGQVEIPNLESLELSSMPMKEISSQSKPFENLTKLNVEHCPLLQYLFSFSMAKSMKKLKDLSVSHCGRMEDIFKYEDKDKHEAKKVRVFPKLEEIHLSWMKALTTIWPIESSPDSFTSLSSISIQVCHKLEEVLPSHMVGRFGRLESLRIIYCDSVQQIFGLNDAKKSSVGDETHLQVLQIDYLNKLEHIWNRDPEGILSFKRLHSIKVTGCNELGYLFPVSVAKSLQELNSFSVSDCPGMEEIARGDEGSNELNFEFPQVLVVEMKRLRKLKCFYKGRHRIEWSKLEKLSIFGCDQLEAFKTETQNSEERAFFLPKEVIPNLEIMEINLKEVEKLKLCVKSYCMNHLKIFLVVSCPSIEILYQFLCRMPHLERLTLLEYCDIKELIPERENLGIGNPVIQENIGTFPQLKYLKLENLKDLENIGLERGPALQYCLEHLFINDCDNLITLGPSSVTLSHLTTLEVQRCGKMKHLMGFSTARSLVQLVSFKVFGCESLEKIVARQNDEVEMTYQHKIVFGKLMTLELKNLQNLSCFCNFKIRNSFEFPSLEKLIVNDCPMMTTLCNQVCKVPNLKVIEIDREEENWSWKWDLNDRMRMKRVVRPFRNYTHLTLADELASVWDGKIPFPDNSFGRLETLVVKNCELSTVIPSHLLSHLPKLEELEVRSCSSVVAIFDVNDNVNVKSSKLRTITLDQLPKMKHVWSNTPEGILSFEHLEQVVVTDCDCVQTLFPVASITESLEALEIKNCGALEEIIAKVEAYEEGAVEDLKFPRLEYLILRKLPKLKSGSMKLQCPSLEYLSVRGDCGGFSKSQIFTSESQNYEGEYHDDQFFLIQKFGDYTHLKLANHAELANVWDKKIPFPDNSFGRLETLVVKNCELSTVIPSHLLSHLPKLEELEVRSCSSVVAIFDVNDNVNVKSSKLRTITLDQLPKMKHVWSNTPEGILSFEHLEQVVVTDCDCVQTLFPVASITESLEALEIKNCGALEEIIAKVEAYEEGAVEDLKFPRLEYLILRKLPKLKSGSMKLQCPSLEYLSVRGDCGGFSKSQIFTSESQNYEGEYHDDQFFLIQKFGDYTHLKLANHAELANVWDKKIPFPDNSFGRLETLVVKNCELSTVIPSHLLSHLPKLEELEVRRCRSVVAIFDLNGNVNVNSSKLRKMTLGRLPKMKHVWNNTPEGILSFEHLEKVVVNDCHCVQTLFPVSSIPKTLTRLAVRNCGALEEIVTKIEGYEEGAVEDLKLPRLQYLILGKLPKLKSGSMQLQCPSLEYLRIDDCGGFSKSQIFTSESQNYQGENAVEDQILPVQQVWKYKVSGLGERLRESELKEFEDRGIPADTFSEPKSLQLQCFHNVTEADTLPSEMLRRLNNVNALSVSEIFPQISTNLGFGNQLEYLPKLNCIGIEHHSMKALQENLTYLEVERCLPFVKLVQYPVSFSILVVICINKCHGLECLFTTPPARGLPNLQELRVINCKSIKEIVAKEEDGKGSDVDEIIFESFRIIKLESLPRLECFYAGTYTLKFPKMYELRITRCPKTNSFSQGRISAPSMNVDDIPPRVRGDNWKCNW